MEDPMAVTTEQATHARSVRTPITQVAAFLQETLGQRLTAVIAGVSDAKAVGQWARDRRAPGPEVQRRLRDAYQITAMLLEVEDAETVRAWFRGMNPDLGDETPARALTERPAEVLQAARDFRAHG
jgi:hypothetical protein